MKKLWIGFLAALLLASCSSYQKDFRSAAKTYQPKPSPTGPWKGTWKSEVNGHHGPLWCLVSHDQSAPQTWHFRYRAGWGVLQFGDYTHSIPAKLKRDGALPVSGKMTLPKNFGTYAVKGTLTEDRFDLRYKGNGDKGTMTLTRP